MTICAKILYPTIPDEVKGVCLPRDSVIVVVVNL